MILLSKQKQQRQQQRNRIGRIVAVMTIMLAALSNPFKAGSRKWMVRALSTTAGTSSSRVNSNAFGGVDRNQRLQQQPAAFSAYKQYSTTSLTSMAAGAVEEDLDTALDELLAGTFDDETKTEAAEGIEHHMKDSKPVPTTLVQEVSFVILMVMFECCI